MTDFIIVLYVTTDVEIEGDRLQGARMLSRWFAPDILTHDDERIPG